MAQSRYMTVVLTVIAILMGLNLWTSWTTGPANLATPAYAQGTVNAAQQRVDIIDQLKKLNASVTRLEKAMTSGSITVQTQGTAD